MAIKTIPEIEKPDAPDLPRTQTRPQRSDGWFTQLRRRVKLAMKGDEEELFLTNLTPISWRVYRDYHMLGIVDAGETRLFRLRKRGKLNVCPVQEQASDAVDYLILDLNSHVMRVEIYRRQMGPEVSVYEMRAA
jgi:hypothetical protein